MYTGLGDFWGFLSSHLAGNYEHLLATLYREWCDLNKYDIAFANHVKINIEYEDKHEVSQGAPIFDLNQQTSLSLCGNLNN